MRMQRSVARKLFSSIEFRAEKVVPADRHAVCWRRRADDSSSSSDRPHCGGPPTAQFNCTRWAEAGVRRMPNDQKHHSHTTRQDGWTVPAGTAWSGSSSAPALTTSSNHNHCH